MLFPSLETESSREVLRVGDRSLTWRALARACRVHAALLHDAGVVPGDRVGVWTQPALETAVALVANAHAGFVSVPLDPKLGPLELGHITRDAAPSVLLAANPSELRERVPGVATLQIALEGPERPLRSRAADDASPALILYTSGTTGLPKGAVLSARNIASNLDGLAQAWAWSGDDTVVHALPLFHVHGLVLGLFGAVRRGGALRWVPKFDPREVSAALLGAQTVLFAVPTMYVRLAEAAAEDPAMVAGLRHARLLVSGSAALPLREHVRLEALLGRKVVERYGMTETLINCAVRAGAPDEAGRVGQGVDGVDVRLVDDARRPLDAVDDVTIGELAVRGPNVFIEYLNRPDATAAVRDEAGWFYTGDLACRRADGSIRIVGRRATDLIKCAGYKVGAGEVEAALLEHPLVTEAAVVGRPDPDLGERIVAYVATSAPVDEQELINFVAGLLSPHKRPRGLHFVDALPRNAMGKVQKSKL